ncbi:MAG TPA: restriction endonuclease subunit S [Micromonosporaceae bacterium]|nr:restriction endonuclease subunit S [Micromonosporaceae bacterium]
MSEAVSWLACSRWRTVPVRRVAKLGTGHTPSRQHPEYWENCTIPWVTLADVWQLRDGTVDVIRATNEKISPGGLVNSAAVKHPAGTVILSRTASIGYSAILGVDMATSQDFATWTCGERLHARYLLYALRAMRPDFKRLTAGSTHKTIYMPDIAQLRIPLPSLDEQRRIADFLDAETAVINTLGAARKRQQALVEERFATKVFNTVRGADMPGSRLASGPPWLGAVPTGWRVASVSSQYDVQLGKMLNQDRTSGVYLRPYLRNTNVQWDYISTDDLLLMDFPPHERRRYEVLPGDLLICEGGEPGRAAIWDGSVGEIYYQKALHRARSRGRSSVRWLYYCLRGAASYGVFSASGNTTTISHLTSEQLRAQRFPFPDSDIQRKLTAELDEQSNVDKMTAKLLANQLALLSERTQALITAAVTGQLDVSAK